MVAAGTETITVLAVVSDAETDWQDDPLPDADPEGGHPEYELKRCAVWSATNADRPDIVLDERGVFVPVPNQPPDAHDTLLYEGVEWSINGSVGPQRKPKTGRLLGWLFSMRRVT